MQFCHPTPWTLLTPLASCITPEHPQRHSAMVSADALDMVLYEINLDRDGADESVSPTVVRVPVRP